MFDFNQFKRSVKTWMEENPQASTQDLQEYCEDLIPTQYYTAHGWVVEQTVAWYAHIITSRAALSNGSIELDEEAC